MKSHNFDLEKSYHIKHKIQDFPDIKRHFSSFYAQNQTLPNFSYLKSAEMTQ